jgi:acyl carrier protein
MKEISANEFKDVLCELLQVEQNEINFNTKISELSLDSLDLMQLFYDIEEKFNVEISEAIFNQINENTDIKSLFELTINNVLLA